MLLTTIQKSMELLSQIANEAVHRENGGVPTPGSRPQYQVTPMFSGSEFPSLPITPKFIPDAQDQVEIDKYLDEALLFDDELMPLRCEWYRTEYENDQYDKWQREAGVDALCQSEVDDMADEALAEYNRAQGDQVDNVPSHPSMTTKSGGGYVGYQIYNGYPMGYWTMTKGQVV